MRRVLLLLTILIILPGALRAAESPLRWLGGDPAVVAWPESDFPAADRLRQAADAGLAWMAVCAGASGRVLTDARAPQRVRGLKHDQVTAACAVRWRALEPAGEDFLSIGVQAELPLPEPAVGDVADWTVAQGGVLAFAGADGKLEQVAGPVPGVGAFFGFVDGQWRSDCDKGKGWDRLLARGRRLVLLGGSFSTARPEPGAAAVVTYVQASGPGDAELARAIRAGRVFVSERDGIRLFLTVNGSPPGSTVAPEGNSIEVGIEFTARHPVDEVRVIGNTVVSESADTKDQFVTFCSFLPGEKTGAKTFRVSVSNGTRYLRAVARSRTGACQTLTNPVFLGDAAAAAPDDDLAGTTFDLLDAAFKGLNWDDAPASTAMLERLLADRSLGPCTALFLGRRASARQLEYLRSLLRSTDPKVRAFAAYVLVHAEGETAADTVLALLDDEAAEPRLYAARVLVELATPARLSIAQRAARDLWCPVRQYGLAALAQMPSYDSVLRLRQGLLERAAPVHEAAAAGLTELLDLKREGRAEFLEAFKNGTVTDKQTEAAVARGDLRPLVRAAAAQRLGAIQPVREEPASTAAPEHFRTLTAAHTTTRPRIDGRGDDALWADASGAAGFALETARIAAHQTTVKAAYAADTLYLLIECAEPHADRLVALERDADGPVWLDDSVEIFLSPVALRKTPNPVYYHLCVNSRGVRFDEQRRQRHWNGEWESAAAVTAAGWSLELALPFRSFGGAVPEPGRTVWLINVVRHRRVAPEEESFFQPGNLRIPAHYADLRFR